MAINLTSKYSDRVAERFKKASLTGGVSNKDYSFEGVKTVKVFSVDTVALTDYNRSGTSRYGTPAELGDTVQELTMGQDKAFTYTIDKGNEQEQLNVKAATLSLRREVDEVVIPALDKHRFDVWCKKAGTINGLAAAPNKNTITGLIMDSTEVLDDGLVPENGRTLFITASMYKVLKENPDFLGVDKLGEAALAKGQVGEIDGMKVVKVPNSYFPAGVYWLITHKSAVLGPAKLQDYKIHKDPPGINGDLVEGRVLHDAFVLEAKKNAVYMAANAAYVANAPTITDDTANDIFNIATTTANATLYYTVDGSDPRYSETTAVYGGNINYAAAGYSAGTVVRTYASDLTNGIFASGVVSKTL
ncbi:MAG: N4-gp56 family major capsid protein [Clostridia bacterium]|nr:N4-gp56 family major capsid protein [Clostridia bacterium]